MIVRTYEEDEFKVHKLPVMAMGVVVAITLAMTMAVSFGFFDRQAVPAEIRAADGVMSVETRSLKFFDTAEGGVLVTDAVSGKELARFAPNTGGFVRATARALIQGRMARGIGPAVPFELISWDNGSMTLRDTQTGQAVEVSSFGAKTNEVYEDILRKGREL